MERIDDGNKVTRLVIEAHIESVSLNADGSIGPAGTLKRWIDLGDFVLVDPRAYFEPKVDDAGTVIERKVPFVWAQVRYIAPGSAAVYPVKVTFDPEAAGFAAQGQYKVEEVLAVQHTSMGGARAEQEFWRDHYTWGD